MPDTPFKFLDAYEKEDKDRFFGRGKETAQLYNAVHASNLMLLYGATGTGKTSLINCGLANKFYDTDWLPVFVRRDAPMRVQIHKELRKTYGNDADWDEQANLTDKIQRLYRERYRTIYLIFDQFEELFVLGDEEEQRHFYEDIRQILQADLPCKIILAMREEYMAYLSEFEKVVPPIFDNRLRIERMNEYNLYRVVGGMANSANIDIKDPQATIPAIVENIRNPREGVELAHVQIYMDKLYREDEKRRKKAQEERNPRFDPTLVGENQQLENVISDFLEEQLRVLEEELAATWDILPNTALNVLYTLVTDDGTKRIITSTQVRERIQQRLGLDVEIIDYCLQRFNELKLIRILPND